MIQPEELKLHLPMQVGNGMRSSTTKVWEILLASHAGYLPRVKELVAECPGLIYAQYNYAPPIHFAVREGHIELVKYLLDNGAHDPSYRFYPFLDTMQTVAGDRGYTEIIALLDEYGANPSMYKHSGDNGRIFYNRSTEQKIFEKAVDQNNLKKTEKILKVHPEFALDNTFFWSEGILMRPAKQNRREMIDLLMSYGAKVPDLLKWTQFYYFELYEGAEYMMEKGMSPNVMSWQRVTILHDMAQKGFIDKAKLLIKYGADIEPVDEAYQSTPLGLAARWGQKDMVEYLLEQGANPNKSGAAWSKPLVWAKGKGHDEVADLLKRHGAVE
jgi:ankyrin repeat protein